MDGASEFKTFFRIVLPLSKPGIATIGMFTMIAYWNDWFLGMLYIVDQEKYPVQTLLWSMQNSLEFMKQSSANALEYAEMAANAPTDSGRMALTNRYTYSFRFFWRIRTSRNISSKDLQ